MTSPVPSPGSTDPRTRTIRVWDLPTRLFHWALALLVLALLISGNIGGSAMDWHARFGYGVLTLLVFRLLWGFVGGYHSRFAHFIPAPSRLLQSWQDWRKGQHPFSVGHNPWGALSVIAMLLLLLLQVGSGLMSDDEIAFSGPLSSRVSGALVSLSTWYHKAVGKPALIGLVLLHLAAIAYHRFRHGERLVSAMIRGDKTVQVPPSEPPVTPSQDHGRSRFLALLCLLLSVAVVLGLLRWAQG